MVMLDTKQLLGYCVFLIEETRIWPSGYKQWLLIAVIALLIGAVGLSALTVIRINESAQPVDVSLFHFPLSPRPSLHD